MTTAQLLAKVLFDRGVRQAFGGPLEAFAAAGIALHEAEPREAVAMAEAAARLTGAPGVAVLPGGVTLLPPARRGDRLECRVTAARAWREVPLALRHLGEGRAVRLELSDAVLHTAQADELEDRFHRSAMDTRRSVLTELEDAVAGARRPVALIGSGDTTQRLAGVVGQVAESLRMPTLSTPGAKGVPDENHDWHAGTFGLDTPIDALQRGLIGTADLLLLIGVDPTELGPGWDPGWPADLPVVAFDTVAPLDLPHPVEALVLGDIALNVSALASVKSGSAWTLEELGGHWDRMAACFQESAPAAAIAALQSALPDDAIVALGEGVHRATASQVWTCSAPNTLLLTANPSAVARAARILGHDAVSVSFEDDQVVVTFGDGTSQTYGA